MDLNRVEQEIIFLKAVNEIIDSMEILKCWPQSETMPIQRYGSRR
jgi:hypothetical protein